MTRLAIIAVLAFAAIQPVHGLEPGQGLVAQASSDTAEIAWRLIRDSSDALVLTNYIEQFPNSPFAEEARVRLELLNDRGSLIVGGPEPLPAKTTREVVLALQAELRDAGCAPGPVDGDWGTRSRQALARFGEAIGRSLGTDPTEPVLATVLANSGVKCQAPAPTVVVAPTNQNQPRPAEPVPTLDVSGSWQSSSGWGATTLAVRGTTLEGSYRNGGRILGTLTGRTAVGRWAENISRRKCDTTELGSNYWGTFRLTFDSTGRSFSGSWSYCNETTRAGDWTGTR